MIKKKYKLIRQIINFKVPLQRIQISYSLKFNGPQSYKHVMVERKISHHHTKRKEK